MVIPMPTVTQFWIMGVVLVVSVAVEAIGDFTGHPKVGKFIAMAIAASTGFVLGLAART